MWVKPVLLVAIAASARLISLAVKEKGAAQLP